MALISKKVNSSTTKQQVIKVNPYENPANVMELMSSICAARPTTDTSDYWRIIYDAYFKEVKGISLYDCLDENRASLFKEDFKHKLDSCCVDIAYELSLNENTNYTQIVVAGGFSSGKSSFLNNLTGSVGLLPTGVEPTSVVKTYLYCSGNCKSVAVRGVNHRNTVVDLDKNVLHALQHSNKNVALASVLDKLFVEVPVNNTLSGIAFVDTPGYNNSDKANASNGKTDCETAREAMKEGNVLLWLVDIERGTITTDDIQMIKKFEGKKVFIFNKADKKSLRDCQSIVEAAARIILQSFPAEEVIDILAYTTRDNKICFSHNGFNKIEAIIAKCKTAGNGESNIERYKKEVRDLFDDEIIASRNVITDYEERYKKAVDEKAKWEKNLESWKNSTLVENLKEVLIDSYDEQVRSRKEFVGSSLNALNQFVKFFNGVMDFENNDHWGSSTILTNALRSGREDYSNGCDIHNAALKNYKGSYETEWRETLLEEVSSNESILVGEVEIRRDSARQSCTTTLKEIKSEEAIIASMRSYQDIFCDALELAINTYRSKKRVVSVQNKVEATNIFKAIKENDYTNFLHSFEDGVDMLLCNAEGYNPMTFAVKTGNSQMVKFMLDHNADPNIKDNRGYNAFHTAVENQYRNICELLLNEDPDLVDTETTKGEFAEDIMEKNTFNKWLESQL